MGKVPALKHGDALITEQVAIFLYLADLFPEAGLAPPIGDPLRGPYLRWMVFYAACFEPAVVDRSSQKDSAPLPMSPYGDFETMFKTLTGQLAKGPYLLGERFSAADVLWGWGPHLDHDVQARPRVAGDHELRAACERPAGSGSGEG